uniref:Uncharacterized protein n=1 Tax=Faecalibaculum rodentium TaxID=1702221 RepID=A0A140DUL8_9FIRM|nr:hypothetical protein AALO17_12110 [Faecalibaculum rodentium]
MRLLFQKTGDCIPQREQMHAGRTARLTERQTIQVRQSAIPCNRPKIRDG